jgi:hypothetical protein
LRELGMRTDFVRRGKPGTEAGAQIKHGKAIYA